MGIVSFILVYFILFFPQWYVLDYTWQEMEILESVCDVAENEEGARESISIYCSTVV